jgi:signal transduction histidine kinase/CheY-like chemotaxis protein
MRPVFRNGQIVGMLCLTSDHQALRQRRKRLLALAGALLALSLAVGGLSGALLQRKISAPLGELTRVMRRVTHDRDFRARVSISGTGEIAQLGTGFNRMLAEIQRREEDLQRSNISLEDELVRRKETNDQLAKAKEEAEIANRTKSQFLANMSHEIRTPMNGVIGMTELALETNLTPEQREYLSTVKLSAESLLSIINDILDFSKIEAGRLELDSFEFNIHEVVGSTLKGIAIRAHQKGLELVYDIRPSVPDILVGDAHRLRQVLVNLVANAIKFTDRGEVVVTLEAAPERGPNVVHMLVRDTGMGIPRDKQDAVFEAFSQADSSHSRRYGGTGLGLAISSRLVRLMGGEIWVRSEPGRGSEFHVVVHLPAGPPHSLDVPEFLRGVAALIVDDNLTQRKILSGMLGQWGMKPDAAESALRGLSAMEAAAGANAAYRLVLIDGNMPGMDGFELAECIQRNPKLAGATVLMLSTGLRPGDITRCRELGVSAYVIKPIRKGELLKVIVRVLQDKDAFTAPAQEQLLAEAERRTGLRILAAEDNRVNQRLLVRLLEKEGHAVTIVEDGEAAVAISAKQAFDLILMDVQMPNLDGLEAARCIRSRELATGKHMPIIALTAHAMKGDRERCLEAGMDAYVAKPVQKQELLHIMYQYIAPALGDPAASPSIRPASASAVFDLATP